MTHDFVTKDAKERYALVEKFAEQVEDPQEFKRELFRLTLAIQSDTERQYMLKRVRKFGEPYMLYTILESVVANERRPVWRSSTISQIKKALGKYLGLEFTPKVRKRKKLRKRRALTKD